MFVLFAKYTGQKLKEVASAAALQLKQVIAFASVNSLVCCTANQVCNLFLIGKLVVLYHCELIAMQTKVHKLSANHIALILTKSGL